MQLDLLDHLLTLAGPVDRAELLVRLEQDLKQAMLDIERFAMTNDRKALGAALHVLIGITGSIGAIEVMATAQKLGQDARDGVSLSPALLAQITGGILTLQGEVLRRKDPGGAAV
jgi:HPt (histidine-containing phosphotransfer) domain-containing protein